MSQQAKSPETSKMVEGGTTGTPEPYGLIEGVGSTKTRGADMIKIAMPNSGELKSEDINTKYQPEPFPKEVLEKKSKGYPEIKVNGKTKDIVDTLEEIFKKKRKEDMDHGDTQSGIWEDKHEYVLLQDKTNKPTTRLFKSNDKK